MSQSLQLSFDLREVEVSPSHNTLIRGDQQVKLQPKVMAVLSYLAQNQNRVIGNEELIESVWSGRIVTHSSVQKSINFLRKALAEFFDDEEVVAHYSKRGYQLKIIPNFEEPAPNNELAATTAAGIESRAFLPRSVAVLVLFVVLGLGAAFLYSEFKHSSLWINATHKTSFASQEEVDNPVGFVSRLASPHPNNKVFAFVRERSAPSSSGANSELVVNKGTGKNWLISSGIDRWVHLEWSPDGNMLAAVELITNDTEPLTPNFYEEPSYLYNIHFYSLDIDNERLVEKHLLRQWQGYIASVSWWDGSTLEFVARQGAISHAQRFHYSVTESWLSVETLPMAGLDLAASSIREKLTALLFSADAESQVLLLNENQRIVDQWKLKGSFDSIRWLPDGSGWSLGSKETTLLYRNGKQESLDVQPPEGWVHQRQRFSNDGQTLYVDALKPRHAVYLETQTDGMERFIFDDAKVEYPRISPDGQFLAFLDKRADQAVITVLDQNSQTKRLDFEVRGRVSSLRWSDPNHLLFKEENTFRLFDVEDKTNRDLLSDATELEPIGFFADEGALIVKKKLDGIDNIWLVDLWDKKQRQLTFGSIGTAWALPNSVLFQYKSKPGLWELDFVAGQINLISKAMEQNVKILYAADDVVAYVSGGVCRESNVYALERSTDQITTVLERTSFIQDSKVYHPSVGLFTFSCELEHSKITLFN